MQAYGEANLVSMVVPYICCITLELNFKKLFLEQTFYLNSCLAVPPI